MHETENTLTSVKLSDATLFQLVCGFLVVQAASVVIAGVILLRLTPYLLVLAVLIFFAKQLL